MNNPKTTIFGTIGTVAGVVAPQLTGVAQLVASILAGICGTLFAYHSTDKKTV